MATAFVAEGPRTMRILNAAVLLSLLLALGVTGCQESPAEPLPSFELQGELGQYLTAELAAEVQAEGVRVTELPASHRYRPVLSPAEAVRMAEHWIANKAPTVIDRLERGHSQPINLQALVADNVPIVAQTPHAPLSDTLPNYYHKAWGPYYLVTFSQEGIPAVMVAVSAFAVDMAMVPGGFAYAGEERGHGNEFGWWGIPPQGLVVTPERAIELASIATGAKVAGRPVYVRRSGAFSTRIGAWRIPLDRSTTASFETKRGRAQRVVSEVYVGGYDARVKVSAADEPVEPEPPVVYPLRPDAARYLHPAASFRQGWIQ